jgi:hypothetical protein
MTYQENIWLIIDRSLVMAKKKCASTPEGGTFIKKNYRDMEDLHYDIEWIEINFIGNPTQEEEEYKEAMEMYNNIGSIFKKTQIPDNPELNKMFNTVRLNKEQLDEAYKAGHGSVADTSISRQLLNLGIMTHIERIIEKAPEIGAGQDHQVLKDSFKSNAVD